MFWPPILLALLSAGLVPGGELQRFAATRPCMGSLCEIVVYAPDAAAARSGLEAAFDRMQALDAIFSDYDSASETLRLCRAAPTEQPVPISPELAIVLGRSLALSRRTGGAFDVTVGPLSRLWRRARRRRELPSDERLREALGAVGYQHVQLDAQSRSVRLLVPDMRLDFGGIAKGFAADQAIRTLRERGLCRALVNAGGDIAIGDPPPGLSGWRIGIARLEPNKPPSRILRLAHCGIATSGDAWQAVEIHGKRYSHIVDPKTGIGLVDRSSVTVWAPDCMTADSLASAVSVLGPRRGIELIEATCGTACLIVRVEHGQAKTYQSKRFPVENPMPSDFPPPPSELDEP